jgi:hypothetical protein
MASQWLGIAEDLTLEGVVGETHGGLLRSARAWLKAAVCMVAVSIVLICWWPTEKMIYGRYTRDSVPPHMGTLPKSEPSPERRAMPTGNVQQVASTVKPAIESPIINSAPQTSESAKRSGRRSRPDSAKLRDVESTVHAPDAPVAADIDIGHFRQLEDKL